MPMDEVDSGVDEVCISESREGSPAAKKEIDKKSMALAVNNTNTIDDDDIDETILERLWGLTEMFPQCVRNGTWTLTTGALSTAKVLYSFSRSALWIFFSSSAILFAPVVFEMERMQLQEDQRQQQRQILLGPSAAVSSSPPGAMGMPMPVHPSASIGAPPPQ